ncbi:MAG TPA: Mur ligase family protein, partial [Bacteroidales bacterium]|nr:Mur ligase family protein [Bacteroidales bacterium]
MRSFSSGEISGIVNGRLSGPPARMINHVIIDSRRFTDPEGAVFVALRGERNDGHAYLTELFNRGLRCFIVEEIPDSIDFAGASFITVDNSLAALQQFAASIRTAFEGEVIAVTGSNGKTIIKEWLYQSLNRQLPIVRSPLSYNSQVGVPLSLFLLDRTYRMAVVEAGISLPGEMARLEKMIRPDTGIFSNIGQAHQENFDSPDDRVAEKMKLFVHCRKLIYCKDHHNIHRHASSLPAGVKRITWSAIEIADYMVSHKTDGSASSISIEGLFTCRFT